MEIDYISIGMRVRKFRRQKGLSQEKLSEMTGLTPAHFSHIETGNTKVSLPSLVKIACAREVSRDERMVDSLTQTRTCCWRTARTRNVVPCSVSWRRGRRPSGRSDRVLPNIWSRKSNGRRFAWCRAAAV